MLAEQSPTISDTAAQPATTAKTSSAATTGAAAVADSVLTDLRLSGLRCDSTEQCPGVMVRSQLLVQSVCTSCGSSESMAVAEARHAAACTALTDSIAAARTSLHAVQAQGSTTTAAAAADATEDALKNALQQLQRAIAVAQRSLRSNHRLLLHADSVVIDICELFFKLTEASTDGVSNVKSSGVDSYSTSMAHTYRSSVAANIDRIEALTQLPSPQLAQLYTQLAKAIAAVSALQASDNAASDSTAVVQQGALTRQQCLQSARHMYTVCCGAADARIQTLDAFE
jgi:hypothetical protein